MDSYKLGLWRTVFLGRHLVMGSYGLVLSILVFTLELMVFTLSEGLRSPCMFLPSYRIQLLARNADALRAAVYSVYKYFRVRQPNE